MDKTPRSGTTTKAPKNRLSVTFPPEVHTELERIAESKKVSLAWVVRDAAEKYIASRYPLLNQR